MSDEAVAEQVRKVIADRRRKRQLLALKITCYVMAAGCLACIGLTAWQLTIPSLYAGVYATLAGVFAAATSITCTIYRPRHTNNHNH